MNLAERRVKGTGSLRINEDGSKTLICSVVDKGTGKRKKLQVTGPNESACNKLMKAKMQEWEKSQMKFSNSAGTTVAQLCYNYQEVQFEQGLLERSSRDRNIGTIKNQIETWPIGHLQIGTVTSKDVDDHFIALFSDGTLSASSLRKVQYALNSAFEWAVSRGELEKNPLKPIKLMLNTKFSKMEEKGASDEDVLVLSDEEKQKIIETSDMKWSNGSYRYSGHFFIKFLLETGMRVGELITLRWKDYDSQNHLLVIDKSTKRVKSDSDTDDRKYESVEGKTKNKKSRTIGLSERAVELLEQHYSESVRREPDDYICLTSSGKKYTATEMEHLANSIYRAAEVSERISSLHILRRTFATTRFREGWSLKNVAAYLGDEEATVSQYYVAARETIDIDGKRIAIVPFIDMNKNEEL